MYLSKRITCVVLHAFILCIALGAQGTEIPNSKIFDRLITKELVASGFKREIPLSFKIFDQGNIRIYESYYQFPRKVSTEHYTCSINIAQSGKLLDPEQYRQRYADVKQNHSDRGKEYFLTEFPNIGKRAQRDFMSAGPGGAAFSLTFTTSDGKFDVRIIISNLLPEGIEDPNFNIEEMARKISELYDKEVGIDRRSSEHGHRSCR